MGNFTNYLIKFKIKLIISKFYLQYNTNLTLQVYSSTYRTMAAGKQKRDYAVTINHETVLYPS